MPNQRYIPSDVDEFTARELFDKFDELWREDQSQREWKGILKGSDYKRVTAGFNLSPSLLNKHHKYHQTAGAEASDPDNRF